MIDIWDEKPHVIDLYLGYSNLGECYVKDDMDAWLEKLRPMVEVYNWVHNNLPKGGATLGGEEDGITLSDLIMMKEKAEKLEVLRRLVEDWLPQIGMTIHFREMFYQIVGEPHPDWFEIPEMGFYERQWIEEVRGLATTVRKQK